MNPILIAKLVGAAAAAAIVAAGALWVAGLEREHVRHGQCLASAQAKPGSKPIADVCDPPIARAVAAATSAAACDSGLASLSKVGAPGVPVACSAPVQAVAAQRDAAGATVQDQQRALDQARADQAAAVSRAAARATAQAESRAHASQVLAAAPRDGDGLSVCDAQCLRQLAGSDPGS